MQSYTFNAIAKIQYYNYSGFVELNIRIRLLGKAFFAVIHSLLYTIAILHKSKKSFPQSIFIHDKHARRKNSILHCFYNRQSKVHAKIVPYGALENFAKQYEKLLEKGKRRMSEQKEKTHGASQTKFFFTSAVLCRRSIL